MTPSLSLVIKSGPQTGKELVLEEGGEIVLGRGKESHIVIDDAKASRRHARFHCSGGELFVEDLGSINGTFVNGSRVEKTSLFAGDAVEVANVRIKIQKRDEGRLPQGITPGIPAPSSDPTIGNVLSDTLSPEKLREVIRFLNGRKRTGTLIVHATWGTGRIYFNEGRVYHADIGGSPASGIKAINRLLRAREGSIEFSEEKPVKPAKEITASIDALLQGEPGFADALSKLERLLPPAYQRLIVNMKHDDAFTPEEREILHLIGTHATLPGVFDNYTGTDSEAARLLAGLAERKSISVVK